MQNTINYKEYYPIYNYNIEKEKLFIEAVHNDDINYLQQMYKYIDKETIKTCLIVAVIIQ